MLKIEVEGKREMPDIEGFTMLEKQTVWGQTIEIRLFQKAFFRSPLRFISQTNMASSERQQWVQQRSQETEQLWDNHIQKRTLVVVTEHRTD